MRRILPDKFMLRERVLSGRAVVLAGTASYFFVTAAPRAAGGVWMLWQLLGTVMFVSVGGRERAFFTGLYCTLHSAELVVLGGVICTKRMPWPPDWSALPSELAAVGFGAFVMISSVLIPIAFARFVTRLIDFLQRQFSQAMTEFRKATDVTREI